MHWAKAQVVINRTFVAIVVVGLVSLVLVSSIVVAIILAAIILVVAAVVSGSGELALAQRGGDGGLACDEGCRRGPRADMGEPRRRGSVTLVKNDMKPKKKNVAIPRTPRISVQLFEGKVATHHLREVRLTLGHEGQGNRVMQT
ncbi:hypothetical protein EDB84DRAFT_1435756 [Lactarius hengduanensis]|nr:hypothetical protein EDB84DRAFT_1435756 [Lactarius hengduanensis]